MWQHRNAAIADLSALALPTYDNAKVFSISFVVVLSTVKSTVSFQKYSENT